MEKYSQKMQLLFDIGEIDNPEAVGIYQKFAAEDIPELVRLATDSSLWQGDIEERKTWAPLHAWHILARLKALETIPMLIEMFHKMEHNHLVDEEVPEVFAEFGGAALPALEKYLNTKTHHDDARISAAACIKEIGSVNKKERDKCIQILKSALEKFEDNSAELNGFLVWYLIDLQAREAFPVIKEAYERNCVDKSLVGEISNVEYLLKMTDKKPTVQFYAEESFDDDSNKGKDN